MAEPESHPLEIILRQCAAAAPQPWYPSAYVQATGTARESLDPHLDRLRLGGLICLTDWVQGAGQGYALTPEGRQVVENPRLLQRLRDGQLPLRGDSPAKPPSMEERGFTTWDRGEAVRAALLGTSTPVVTFVLIYLNLAVFVAGMTLATREQVPVTDYLSGRSRLLLDLTGAISGRDFYLRQQWWRLLTCCFVHVGWMHLAVNMYSLYIIGPLLERLWGHARLLLLYLIAGVCGSCGLLIENPIAGGAGASGAIWGIIASMGAWLFLHRRALPPELRAQWQSWLVSVLLLNVFITLFVPGISKGAHFMGGAVGLIAAFPMDYLRSGRPGQRWLAVVALLGIVLVCLGFLVKALSGAAGQEIREWQERQEQQQFLPVFPATPPDRPD